MIHQNYQFSSYDDGATFGTATPSEEYDPEKAWALHGDYHAQLALEYPARTVPIEPFYDFNLFQHDMNAAQEFENATVDKNQEFSFLVPAERPYQLKFLFFTNKINEQHIFDACRKALIEQGHTEDVDSLFFRLSLRVLGDRRFVEAFVSAKNQDIGMTLLRYFQNHAIVLDQCDEGGLVALLPGVHFVCEPQFAQHQSLLVQKNLPLEFQEIENVRLYLRDVPKIVLENRYKFCSFLENALGVHLDNQIGRGQLNLSLRDAFLILDQAHCRDILHIASGQRFKVFFDLDIGCLKMLWQRYFRYWSDAELTISGFPSAMPNAAIVSLVQQITPISAWVISDRKGAQLKNIRVLCEDAMQGARLLHDALHKSSVDCILRDTTIPSQRKYLLCENS